MPPKATRGRGGTRARGSARGGSTAGKATASARPMDDAATPQPSESAIPTEEATQAVTPKPEVLEGAPTETSTAGEAAQSTPNELSSATTTPQDGSDASSRAPVQRLASLNSTRSASPAVRRGVSSRGKKGIVKPPFSGRRSKEERETRDKELLEREKERRKEQDAADAKKRKDIAGAARRAERSARGRGGYSAAMSGPFSLGSSRDGEYSDNESMAFTKSSPDRKNSSRGMSGYYSGSGSRATYVKSEGGPSGSGSGSRSTGGPSIKKEDGGYISSEDEDDAEFPRIDIDLIELSSDDDTAQDGRPQRLGLPVRIVRKEHQERTIGINTEASADVGGKAAEHGGLGAQSSASASRKHTSGKGKGSEIEVTSVKKPFRGVWQDDEDASPIKTEQNSDNEDMPDAEQIGSGVHPPQRAVSKEEAPEAEQARSRVKGIAEPVLQTNEDRAEWARILANMRHMRAELGPSEPAVADSSGDVNMEGSSNNTKVPTVRDNAVYIFQLPPAMPSLVSPHIKSEPLDEQDQHGAVKATSGSSDVKVKVEEGFTDSAAKGPEAQRFVSGRVGKVRVRQSGRTTLDWGGLSFDLRPGLKAPYVQEAVSVDVQPPRTRVVAEDAGEAISLGRIKGMFTVALDLDELLD